MNRRQARSASALYDPSDESVSLDITTTDGERIAIELLEPALLADSLMAALLRRKDYQQRAAKMLRLDAGKKKTGKPRKRGV